MADIATLLQGIAAILWPIVALVLVVRFSPAISVGGQFFGLTRGAVALLSALLFVSGCAAQSSLRRTDQSCTRVALDPGPRWSFSGMWREDGEELVLADLLGGQLLRYDRRGGLIGAIAHPGNGELEFQRPGWLVDAGAETILIHGLKHLVGLDETLNPVWGRRLVGERDDVSEQVTLFGAPAIFEGALISPMRIGSGSDSWFGYGRTDLTGDFTPRKLVSLPAHFSEKGRPYGFGGTLIAVAAGGVYALRFEPEPHLQQLLPTQAALSAFPHGFSAPLVPPVSGPDEMEAADALVRQSTMISGVLGQGRFLYLLTREPGPNSETRWLLHQIDPVADELVWQVRIPTPASHLIVVPGEERWAFVEKGSVTGSPPVQEIGSVLMIPTSVIDGRSRGSSTILDCPTDAKE